MLVLFILPLAGAPPAANPNELVRVELATSIAFWARFDLQDSTAIYGLSEDVSVHNGRVYSDKAPGLSFVSTPIVWIVNPILARAPGSDLPAYWPLRHGLTRLVIGFPTVALVFLGGAGLAGIST